MRYSHLLYMFISAAMLLSMTELFADKTADHSEFKELKRDFQDAAEVTEACLSCHTEAGKQIMDNIHWTWTYKTEGGRIAGKAAVVNNFCVHIESNEPRCTSCHIGYNWKNKEYDFTKQKNIDCLVCHEQTGNYNKFPTAAGHPVYEEKMFQEKKKFVPPDLSKSAQSVSRPQVDNCGTCHFYGGGGNGVKHGDLDNSLSTASKDLDVHMGGEDMQCVDCHKTEFHKIPGSNYGYRKEEKRPTCLQGCHTQKPHKIAKLNDHTDKIACQTCHVPQYARGGNPTKMWWDWSKAGNQKRKNTKTYNVKKGEFRWGENVEPEYRWHNGDIRKFFLPTDKFDPQNAPITINKLDGRYDDSASKIYPFKVHRGKQIYDTKNDNFIIPHLFGTIQSGAYWKIYDWDKAAEGGMKYAGLPYSGEYGFIETEMYWPITHMVSPKEQALKCNACHTRGEDSRMAGIKGVFLPGKDHVPWIDAAGAALVVLSLLGVITHGVIGRISRAVRKKRELKRD